LAPAADNFWSGRAVIEADPTADFAAFRCAAPELDFSTPGVLKIGPVLTP
jgi:hypothetical protein